MHTTKSPVQSTHESPGGAPATARSTSDHALEVRHFTKRYGSAVVVDDLSFELPRGHVVGLIGPNGAGKTTVMKSLVGLVAPTGGDLTVLGVPVGSPGWGRVLADVGTMIEGPPLYGRMTARENLHYQSLALGQTPTTERIDEILSLVGLLGEAELRPHTFSLGMKQRLGIAITLIGDPKLIILDEPANGLDPAGILEIRKLLRRMPELDTTVLVSSHQLGEVQESCDSLVVLDRGALVTAGTTSDIVASRAEHAFDLHVAVADRPLAEACLTDAGHSIEWDDDMLVIRPAGDVRGRDIARTLADHGVYADALAPRSISLEEAFLDMTTAR